MRNFWALVFGAAIGTFAFFLSLMVVANHAPDALLRTVRMILVAEPSNVDSISTAAAVTILQQRGLGISADSYIGRITDFYSIVLQIAFAAFVLFGVVSFFAIRWQSNQAAEDLISEKTGQYFKSTDFTAIVNTEVSEATDIAMQPIDAQIRQLSTFVARLEAVEAAISASASAEEPDESSLTASIIIEEEDE